MSISRVAIIGSNGFIGKHLADNLLQNNNISVDLYGRSATSSNSNPQNYKQIDLFNSEQNKIYFKNIEVIYYLASETIPANSWANPLVDIEKNLIPFLTFMESICNLNIKKMIYLSSAGTVYGTTSNKVDELSDKNPFSPYGITKLAIENFLLYYKTKYNIEYDIFRISNVYGPGQNTKKGLGIINTFIEKIIKNEEITIFGNGSNLRNYIYVKDVVKILNLLLFKNLQVSKIYNLNSDDSLTINEIVDLLKKMLHENLKVTYDNKRLSDNMSIDLNNSKLKNELPFFKFTPITVGIVETFNYIKRMPNN